MKNTLANKLDNNTAVIGVFGLGYVGLPLAIEYCQQGFRCIGFEISSKKINMVNSGKSDIGDVSNAQVKSAVSKKLLKATADFSLLKQCDVAAICVPTPLSKTKDPDVSFILHAVEELRKYLHKEMLVILESTTYPGTTEEYFLLQLQQIYYS